MPHTTIGQPLLEPLDALRGCFRVEQAEPFQSAPGVFTSSVAQGVFTRS